MADLKVYVVDDDQDIIDMATLLLESRGHRVKSNISAIHALTEIPAFHPDCIITDLMMPAFDGMDFCKELRSDKKLKHVKIVMCSVWQSDHWAEKAQELGADGYIKKPIDKDNFVDQVEGIYNKT